MLTVKAVPFLFAHYVDDVLVVQSHIRTDATLAIIHKQQVWNILLCIDRQSCRRVNQRCDTCIDFLPSFLYFRLYTRLSGITCCSSACFCCSSRTPVSFQTSLEGLLFCAISQPVLDFWTAAIYHDVSKPWLVLETWFSCSLPVASSIRPLFPV